MPFCSESSAQLGSFLFWLVSHQNKGIYCIQQFVQHLEVLQDERNYVNGNYFYEDFISYTTDTGKALYIYSTDNSRAIREPHSASRILKHGPSASFFLFQWLQIPWDFHWDHDEVLQAYAFHLHRCNIPLKDEGGSNQLHFRQIKYSPIMPTLPRAGQNLWWLCSIWKPLWKVRGEILHKQPRQSWNEEP